MNIIYIHRATFQNRPPVISTVINLLENNVPITLITGGIKDYYKKILESKGANVIVIPFQTTNAFWKNAKNSIQWGIKARKEIKKQNNDSVLWIEGNYTIGALGGEIINNYRHVLQIQELFDPQTRRGRMDMRSIGKTIKTAEAVTTPEYNRSHIVRAWYKLNNIPYVLPNKPYFIPNTGELSLYKDSFSDVMDKVNGRKIILYQGILSGERNLKPMISALATLPRDEYVTVLMGKRSPWVDIYKKIDPNLLYVPFHPAPEYLYLTSKAYVGILSYAPTELNLIYCAPNKIFEYACFSIPMIGNDIPGLKYTIESNGLGVLCDIDDSMSVINAFNEIKKHHEAFSSNAKSYFDAVNNRETIKEIIDGLK